MNISFDDLSNLSQKKLKNKDESLNISSELLNKFINPDLNCMKRNIF